MKQRFDRYTKRELALLVGTRSKRNPVYGTTAQPVTGEGDLNKKRDRK